MWPLLVVSAPSRISVVEVCATAALEGQRRPPHRGRSGPRPRPLRYRGRSRMGARPAYGQPPQPTNPELASPPDEGGRGGRPPAEVPARQARPPASGRRTGSPVATHSADHGSVPQSRGSHRTGGDNPRAGGRAPEERKDQETENTWDGPDQTKGETDPCCSRTPLSHHRCQKYPLRRSEELPGHPGGPRVPQARREQSQKDHTCLSLQGHMAQKGHGLAPSSCAH